MKTAEEYLASKGLKGVGNLLVKGSSKYSENGTQKLMIEFAKMHAKNIIQEFKERVNYGIYQNDDGQEPFHHESNIFIDFGQVDEQELIENIK